MFLFIQEHWLSTYEATDRFSSDFTEYEFLTTSSNTFSHPEDIILETGPIWHGTALGWHSSVGSDIVKIPLISTRFCGVKVSIDEHKYVAYTVYLPTSGQDDLFLEEIALLSNDILRNSEKDSIIILGLDSNCSNTGTPRRQEAFALFKKQFSLKSIIPGTEPTFHHNNGTSETQIDFILTNNTQAVNFVTQKCKLKEPSNLSSHDAIIGQMKISKIQTTDDETDYSDTYDEFCKKKVEWMDDNQNYKNMTTKVLNQLLETYNEQEHLPTLIEMISNMFVLSAEKCFQVKTPSRHTKKKTPTFSKALQDAHKNHIRICKEWRKAGRPSSDEHPAKLAKKESQRNLQKIARQEEHSKVTAQNDDLMHAHKNNITETWDKLKKIRGESKKSADIPEVKTLNGTYRNQNVLEGFRANTEYLCNEKSDKNFSNEFLKRCEDDLMIISELSEFEPLKIPPLKLEDIKKIIFRKLKLKKACDVYKLTVEHLRYAGDNTLSLLCTFINQIMDNLRQLSAPEFKLAIASIIYKGKKKPRNLHKSYRLVRVSPLLARILDEHIRPEAVKITKPLQSINQYGFSENITYLMGALQRHEAQKYCIDTKKTFFGCSLDGDSAFEVVCRKIQQRELYFSGESGQLSQYNAYSYTNTQTRIKMNGQLSAPLEETLGVGQGKIRSSDHYKIYVNPLLKTLESADLGVNIGPINTGVSGVADDVYLLTDNQTKLQALIDIAQYYGDMYRIEYGASKTVVSVIGSKPDMEYFSETQPWTMDNMKVKVDEDNDHLGLIVSGIREEEKNVDKKMTKARASLFGLLGPGLSQKSSLSPSVKLHLYRVYICPIARSGLSAMTLRTKNLEPLSIFQRKCLRGFLQLSDRSPIPALFFLTGELPIEAKLHRDIFSTLYNIWLSPQTKIYTLVNYLLEHSPSNSRTWSQHVKNLIKMYGMKNIDLESTPPPKSQYKSNILDKITQFWERKFRTDAQNNSKMKYLNVDLTGLSGRCHPALRDVSTTQQVTKMRPHLKMLCNDYYTYEQKAKYQGGSPTCRLCSSNEPESLEHILTICNNYSDVRRRILTEMRNILENVDYIETSEPIFSNNQNLAQFILDCTSANLPIRINYCDKTASKFFELSRGLCYSIHKTRLYMLKGLADQS